MDIAVFADIHGNYVALDTCINHALEQGISMFLFLGDYVGELAYPEKTMKMLYEYREKYDCTFIKGNKEDYWIDYRENGGKTYSWADNNSTTGMLLYAYKHLSEYDIDFFESLPIQQKMTLDGYKPFIICHGSPYSAREKMSADAERTYEIMDSFEEELIICGHSHEQGKIVHNKRVLLNPGSVGVPFHSAGKSQYLILHGSMEGWKEEFISLEYDIDMIIRDMQEEQLHIHAPYWSYFTKKLLKDGKIGGAQVLSRAMELCREELGKCEWPNIPEIYWERAVKELYE